MLIISYMYVLFYFPHVLFSILASFSAYSRFVSLLLLRKIFKQIKLGLAVGNPFSFGQFEVKFVESAMLR